MNKVDTFRARDRGFWGCVFCPMPRVEIVCCHLFLSSCCLFLSHGLTVYPWLARTRQVEQVGLQFTEIRLPLASRVLGFEYLQHK